MKISVFGGSSPSEGSPAYQQAYELGQNLALDGHTVLTGGYIGTMEAISKGASEGGGHVIGVTCQQLESWRPINANKWVKEERRKETLQDRLLELIENCDICMALPGGAGTLTEISLCWNLMIIHAIQPKPLILIGIGWKHVMTEFYKVFDAYLQPSQEELIHFASDTDEAIQLVRSIDNKK
ncbi:MAG: LOG family protein [Anaerolineales bacterium]